MKGETGINPQEFANIAATEETFWWFRGMDRMLWDFLGRHAGAFADAPACEVGCGTGWVSAQFQARYPLSRLTSLDLEREGLAYARHRGLHRLVLGDIRTLPWKGASFRLLLAMDVIAHLRPGEEGAALREFARVLQPGGVVVMRASAFDWLRSRHSAFVHERQRYTRAKLAPVLAAAGLQPLRWTYANSLLLPVALFKFRVWEPLTNSQPESGLQAVHPLLNRVLERILRLEAAWLRMGGRFPVGQSLWVIARKVA
ncbi:MAG: methyltransferase domain-containing protein, partial [Bryobacterales bacterium]|nr:methyltransferase domain-containing protein [Bryobacterales bacterium]